MCIKLKICITKLELGSERKKAGTWKQENLGRKIVIPAVDPSSFILRSLDPLRG